MVRVSDTLTHSSSSSSTTLSDYTVQTLELKVKVLEFGQLYSPNSGAKAQSAEFGQLKERV